MFSRDAIKKRFQQILIIDEHPHRTSLAFAVGIFISFSPIPGTQTISASVVAWFFKLNIAVTITGTLFSNPLTFVLIYGGSLCFGTFILGNLSSCYPLGLSKKELFFFMKSMPVPLFTGTLILGILAALISYFVLYRILMRYQKKT